jgi:hypothetical protein
MQEVNHLVNITLLLRLAYLEVSNNYKLLQYCHDVRILVFKLRQIYYLYRLLIQFFLFLLF